MRWLRLWFLLLKRLLILSNSGLIRHLLGRITSRIVARILIIVVFLKVIPKKDITQVLIVLLCERIELFENRR